jgi:carboxyl-terminal processing protease
MTQRTLHPTRLVALLAALAGVFLFLAPVSAEPKLAKQDPLIAQLVCEFLKHGHLRRPDINDEVSRRLFRSFLKTLDSNKLYFLKSDIDEFKKEETKLDDQLLDGDLSFPYKVYQRLMKRMEERQKLIEELVNETKHDFTVKEYLETDPDTLAPAADAAEMRERWRKHIKFDLLMQRVAEKPVSEAEAKKKVLERYQGRLKRLKQFDNSDLLELYLTDLATSIDPHSTYMSSATLDDFEIALRLNLDGIGALLGSENGQMTVSEVVAGGAAAKDGRLKAKDKIVAVAQGDDKYVDIVDMKLRDAVKLIRGKRGTKVQLKVVPVGKIEPIVYELTRQKIELKSQEARGEIVEQGKKADGKPYLMGVIDLPSFYADQGASEAEAKSATEDVRKILKQFEAKHVDGVILDLRHNGGGLLTEARALTGLFIDQGPVVQVKRADGKVEQQDDPEKGTVYAGPLIVLVSRRSASASEILASTLQDYGRALIVGDSTTYGKGTVQTVIDLGSRLRADPPPKLGALKLTIQQFYRVNGDSTQNRGVASDVVLPSLIEQLTPGEKESEHALAFDKVKPAEHDQLGLVPASLKAALKERSAKRIKASADFARLAKAIDLVKERKARKTVPLNEKELRALLAHEGADKLEKMTNDLFPAEAYDKAKYKFARNFVNNEVLQIMEDFVQGKKLVKGD